jgi:hypothetical protein
VNDNGQGMPVTIVRPSGPGQDLLVQSLLNLIRIWAIRRALCRFFPENDFSYRDVVIAVAAIRWLQVGSDYPFWTREPLTWTKNLEARMTKVFGRWLP